MSDRNADEEAIEKKQRLKAALHYSVGVICNKVEGMTFSREIVAILTETAFKQAELLATDLELFAKHAKRSTVSTEDVRLCSRHSPSLLQFITEQGEQIKAERAEQQRPGKEGDGGKMGRRGVGKDRGGKEGEEKKVGTGEKRGRGGSGKDGEEGEEKKGGRGGSGKDGGEDEENGGSDDGQDKRTNKAGRVNKKTNIYSS